MKRGVEYVCAYLHAEKYDLDDLFIYSLNQSSKEMLSEHTEDVRSFSSIWKLN